MDSLDLLESLNSSANLDGIEVKSEQLSSIEKGNVDELPIPACANDDAIQNIWGMMSAPGSESDLGQDDDFFLDLAACTGEAEIDVNARSTVSSAFAEPNVTDQLTLSGEDSNFDGDSWEGMMFGAASTFSSDRSVREPNMIVASVPSQPASTEDLGNISQFMEMISNNGSEVSFNQLSHGSSDYGSEESLHQAIPIKMDRGPAHLYIPSSPYVNIHSKSYRSAVTEDSRMFSQKHYLSCDDLGPPTPPSSATGSYMFSSFSQRGDIYPQRHGRRQSLSKMPLTELYTHMGLSKAHQQVEAKAREEEIMAIVQEAGFDIGNRTWIRDTEEGMRRKIIDTIYNKTYSRFGYDKRILEAIVRRGTYARMQSRLRKFRRSKKASVEKPDPPVHTRR